MELNNYVSLHTHTTYSVRDSTTSPEEMLQKAKEFGMRAIAFTEHGNISDWIKKKQYCEKYGIKYIHGMEAYMTETLDEKIRDNYHVILLAKNLAGVHELNELYTKSTALDGHFYYNNRITFDEFIQTSDNIIRLSACLGGVLAKLDKQHPRYTELMNKFDFLEVQPHDVEDQKVYNSFLQKQNKPLIATGDFHEATEYKSECRKIWKKGLGIRFENEDDFNLVIQNFEDFKEAFIQQGVLGIEEINEALNNTNVVADMVEDFELDYSFKFPNLYDDAKNKIREDTYEALDGMITDGTIDGMDFDTYEERIETELTAFDTLNMESFILFMSELMLYCRANNIAVGAARGSASGSLVCYLLGVTDVNPIVWGTNFTRFINVNRISLPDIDSDFSPKDRKLVYEYIEKRFGSTQSSYITTFQKLKTKRIIEDVSKAVGYDVPKMVEIKNGYEQYELQEKSLDGKLQNGEISDKEHEEKMSALEKEKDEFLGKYEDLFYYYKGLRGSINATGYHPAGMIGAPINIAKTIGLREKKGGGYISSCDMKAVDSLNYVKYDILSLKTLQVIKDTYNILGENIPLSKDFDWEDEEVFNSMGKSPIGLFQFESDSSWAALKNFGCKSVRDIAFVTAIIRPSCASFRDKAIKREVHANPNEKIDEVLEDSLGYLVYQEQQIAFLQKLCGFTEGEADVVRRAIGKKSQELLDEWLPKIEAGYIENSEREEKVAKEEFKEFLQVFMDAVNYSFSYNHAIAYSMITYMTAWLRHYHPVEFITAYLNNATNEDDINSGTELAKVYGIKILNPEFGKSNAEYTIVDGDIVKGIGSILYVSKDCAEELLEISKHQKDTYSIIKACMDSKRVDIRQLTTLAKVGFFSKYCEDKTLVIFIQKMKEYNGKKQIRKSTIPKGTEKIVRRMIKANVDGFRETVSLFKVDSERLLMEMYSVMPQVPYSASERVCAQLSYIGYVQDKELLKDKTLAMVETGKSRFDSFKLSYMNGGGAWVRFDDYLQEPQRGDIIMVTSEGKVGRDTIVYSYEKIELDRKTQANKK